MRTIAGLLLGVILPIVYYYPPMEKEHYYLHRNLRTKNDPVPRSVFFSQLQQLGDSPPILTRPYSPRYSGDSDLFVVNQLNQLRLSQTTPFIKNNYDSDVFQNNHHPTKPPSIGN
jgi:hypothetical protein